MSFILRSSRALRLRRHDGCHRGFLLRANPLRVETGTLVKWYEQPQDHQNGVLPPALTARIALERASTFGWERYVGKTGGSSGMKTFGASAPLKAFQEKFGFQPERIVATAGEPVGRA